MKKRITLKDYIEDYYLPYLKEKSRKESNFNKEIKRIKVITASEFVKIPVVALQEGNIIEFLSKLQKERHITQNTVNRYISRLKAIFNYLLRNRLIVFNPAQFIKKTKEYPRSSYLNESEVRKLLNECKNSQNKELYLITVLALNTGMRQGEILNLKKSNIIGRNIILFGEQTKSGLPRTIPMNDTVQKLLADCLRDHHKDNNLFLCKNIRAAFNNAMTRAGIEGVRFHDLRRTFATYLKDSNIHNISILLGHTSIATTERYLGIDEKKLLDSVQFLRFS